MKVFPEKPFLIRLAITVILTWLFFELAIPKTR